MNRLPFLDLLRGLAIVLMALDHAVVVFGWPEELRHLTRPALPAFMVVSGYLFTRVGPRYFDVVLAALVTWPVVQYLGLVWIHILLVYALVVPGLALPLGLRVVVGSLGLLQAMTWPLGWGGYEPGYVFAFLVLGNLLAYTGIRWPEVRFRLLEVVGQWPLSVYVGHLVALAGVKLLT